MPSTRKNSDKEGGNTTGDLPSVIALLGSDTHTGLSQTEAASRLARAGKNVLQMAKSIPWWKRFAAQFQSLIIGLLVAAAIIAGLLGDWIDTAAILAIVVMNAILGFVQEQRAHQAMVALNRLSAPLARVRRDSVLKMIQAEELVVGDIIQLEAGDRLPADARLVEEYGLQTLESSLTGESTPVFKRADVTLPPNTPLAERINCLFAGTTITAGKATAIVTATGMNTEIGSIARLLQDTASEQTPLQRQLTRLGQVLVKVCLSLVSVIFAIQWLRGGSLVEVMLTSVSLAVAAVPEGLPAVVTVTLAIGMQRMAKRNALIRKLPSVETLGCVTVICTDKTGTLTRNEMTVRKLWVVDRSWRVDGEGYSPQGHIHTIESSTDSPDSGRNQEAFSKLLLYADSCNNSQWSQDFESEKANMVGDPTEIALKVVAAKAGIVSGWSLDDLVHENPFESNRKRMSQVYREQDGSLIMIVKGAPEAMLAVSTRLLQGDLVTPMQAEHRRRVLERSSEMAAEALRVLAIGFRKVVATREDMQSESELIFVGLIGMLDPPRPEAREAVERCRNAGIRPIMITGDHPNTAIAIANAVGIANTVGMANTVGIANTVGMATAGDVANTGNTDASRSRVMIGSDIDGQSEQDLASQIMNYSVIARVSAEHKLRVVKAWKSHGHVVAMTGDGVNDAPAVKAADIGVVMGITGTDVAKEAADMVLTDDNFASIVSAVEEGRGIYENIRKFLQFLLASNSSEVMFMFAVSVIGWPSPLLAIQILWINLVTDGIPALALASEPLGKDLMKRPPRPVNEPILNWNNGRTILVHGLLMAIVSIVGFAWFYQGEAANLDEARAVAFCVLTFSQIFYSMACRDLERIMPSVGVFSNPLLVVAMLASIAIQILAIAFPWSAKILGLQAMPWSDLPLILVLSLIPVTLVEVKKIFTSLANTRTPMKVSEKFPSTLNPEQ
ncbi:MAG: cation-translocating P-type ATPase [Pirellula sp.]